MPKALPTLPLCGIDFGTSNSAVGLIHEGRPSLLTVEADSRTIPTAIFFSFEDNKTYFGRQAFAEYIEGTEGRFMRALKSLLGSSLIHEKLRIKSHKLEYADIISTFLGHLKSRIELEIDHEIHQVVLGRPVHFVDNDPAADAQAQRELELAARSQGFREIEFQFEPVAAALEYEQSVSSEEIAFIADIGGGTSDFSIVKVSPERSMARERQEDILANSGVHIGGTDFDRLLSLSKIMPFLGYHTRTTDGIRELPNWPYVDLATWQRINFLNEPKVLTTLKEMRYDAANPILVDRLIYIVQRRLGYRLATSVEQAKIALTEQLFANLEFQIRGESLSVSILREEFDLAIQNAVERTIETIKSTLSCAGLTANKISTVFLTGGSVAIPLLKNEILRLFQGSRVVEGDLFGSVALGLALDANRKFGDSAILPR